eukprot:8322-Heterococcus_DN1.PRE.2
MLLLSPTKVVRHCCCPGRAILQTMASLASCIRVRNVKQTAFNITEGSQAARTYLNTATIVAAQLQASSRARGLLIDSCAV